MMLYYKYSVLICTVVLYVATLALAADNLADCGSGDFKVNSIWSNGAKGKIYFNHSRFTMTWSVNVNFTSPIDPTKLIVPNGDKVKCASPTSCSFTVSSWNPLVIVGTKLTIDYEVAFNGTTTPTIAALGLNGVRMCGGPPVNGNWGSWTDSSSCSKTCGGGTMTQTRVCNHPTPAYGGNSCPGSSSQTVNCNINPCPVNGNWGAWTESSSCTVTCGGGTKTLMRVCNNPEPAHGGRSCPGSSSDTVVCNTDPCPVNGGWGAWSDSSECSVSCGDGTKSQGRECNNPAPAYGGSPCSESATQEVPCNLGPCPVNGGWGPWSDSTECTVSCGDGTKLQTRECNNPVPEFGGNPCLDSATQEVPCNLGPCPVNGGWGPWSDSSECSLSCGDGTKSQTRECNNPVPEFGGSPCSDSATQDVPCNLGPCPVNGGWGPWSDSSDCSLSCGDGTKSQTRECNNPVPEFGGSSCSDSATQEVSCNLGPCPVNGGWGPWSDSSACSVSCGVGTQSQTRECNNPSPANGGNPCPGLETQDVSCNLGPCPVNGGWGPWSDSSDCTVSCGDGTKSQKRECNNPSPSKGGAPCPNSATQQIPCNLGACPAKLFNIYVHVFDATTNIDIKEAKINFTVVNGPSNSGQGITDNSGNFLLGKYTQGQQLKVSALKSGYNKAENNFVIQASQSADQYLSLGLSPLPKVNEARIVMTWNAEPKDLDIHVLQVHRATKTVACSLSYNHKACPGVVLDVDNTKGGTAGAETVTLSQASDFVYLIYVYDFTNNPTVPLTKSGATVDIYGLPEGSVKVRVPQLEPNAGNRSRFWIVGCVDGLYEAPFNNKNSLVNGTPSEADIAKVCLNAAQG